MKGCRYRVLAVLLLIWRATSLAQTTGEALGNVTDSFGGALPGVTVEAFGAALQGTRNVTTGRDGSYRLPALAPGSYRIRASLSGFRPEEKSAVVTLDGTVKVDLTLSPSAEESVAVTGDAPLIDLSATTTGTVYPTRVIERLPVSRNYADIVRSNPGVQPDRGETQGRSLALAIYGATSAENLWIIDGVNTTNVLKGSQGKAINTEFVQEVEVKTGGYQAEYGRALGGIVNVITKSGGNQFHGAAFGYYDSSSTAAERRITSEDSVIQDMRIAKYRRADYGLDLGGYLWKDRLWFFGAYDRVTLTSSLARYVSSALVSTDDRFPLDGTDNLYSGKLTANLSSASSLVATVFADPTSNKGAGGADPRQGFGSFRVPPVTSTEPATWDSTRYIGATDYALRASQLFGSAGLLVAQGSRHQDRYELIAPDLVRTRDRTCPGGTSEHRCSPPPTDNFVTGGYGQVYGPSNRSASRRDQFRADLNLYAGAHEIKVGGDFQSARTDAVTSYSGGQQVTRQNERGVTYYVHDFFANSLEDLTPAKDFRVAPRTRDAGLYLQDSWRAGSGVTLNVGIRWDQEDTRNFRDERMFKTSAEWQPRLGVVWDPGKSGTTKVYAFAGRFYYALPTNLAARTTSSFVFARTFNFDPLGVAQDSTVPRHNQAIVLESLSGEPADTGLKGIYQDEYTLGIERLLAPGFSMSLKATYRRLGNVIEDRCDLDYTAPGNEGNSCALVNPGSNGRYARGDYYSCTGLDYPFDNCTADEPYLVFGSAATPHARRLYRGIEMMARKSVGERLWVQASYVFSSLRGNYDGEISEGYFGQTDPGINFDFDYPVQFHNDYGRLFLDRPHQARLDAYYVTPFGLSVGLQAFVRSGAPLNKLGYFNQFGAAIQLVPKGYAGRMPAEWDANVVLGYPIRVGAATVTLQAYVYNLFNNQIATSRNTEWSTAPPDDYPASLYDPNQPRSNPEYGKVTSRLDARSVRGAVKISF